MIFMVLDKEVELRCRYRVSCVCGALFTFASATQGLKRLNSNIILTNSPLAQTLQIFIQNRKDTKSVVIGNFLAAEYFGKTYCHIMSLEKIYVVRHGVSLTRH